MATYYVEMEGNVREVYEVEADSEAEAMRGWAGGSLVIQESFGCEAVSASLVDDE